MNLSAADSPTSPYVSVGLCSGPRPLSRNPGGSRLVTGADGTHLCVLGNAVEHSPRVSEEAGTQRLSLACYAVVTVSFTFTVMGLERSE